MPVTVPSPVTGFLHALKCLVTETCQYLFKGHSNWHTHSIVGKLNF